MEKYIEIEDFAKRYDVKVKTVMKRLKNLKGYKLIDGKVMFKDTARYPFKIRGKINNREKKESNLLLAIYEYKYIDEVMLKLSKSDFLMLVDELEEMNLIKKNNSNDMDGINNYSPTKKTTDYIREQRKTSLDIIGKLIKSIISIKNNY